MNDKSGKDRAGAERPISGIKTRINQAGGWVRYAKVA